MITLEQAYKLAKPHFPEGEVLAAVYEYPSYWTFGTARKDGIVMIGNGCVAIDKKDGRYWVFFVHLRDDWDKGKEVPNDVLKEFLTLEEYDSMIQVQEDDDELYPEEDEEDE